MQSSENFPKITIGLDLGDTVSQTCELNEDAQVIKRASVATKPAAIEAYFGGRERCRVVLEVGTHSPWVWRLLRKLGHEALVANTARMYRGQPRRKKKSDRLDAEFLARQGRSDRTLLYPIEHRGEQAQQHLALIRARDQLVRARTGLVNGVRGSVKPVGGRIPKCSTEAFAGRAREHMPEELRPALEPLLDVIADLSARIRKMDAQIEEMVAQYPAVQRLRQLAGVGPLTAMGFVLLVEDPKRFKTSRAVGPYFGLTPQLEESSDFQPQRPITKAGDELGRRLLVNAAHYILGPHGPACDLRRHGEAISARGGKNAKKRAVVAVARKLAILMHRLWTSEAEYDPDHVLKRRSA